MYLDPDLTDEFLSQAEGGLYEEEAQSEASGQERKKGAGIKLPPTELGASRAGMEEATRARTVKQTAESAFNRLTALLDAAEAVQSLEALDEAIWDQLQRGEVLEIEATLSVPALVQFGHLANTAEPFFEVMKTAGEPIDKATTEAMDFVSSLAELIRGVPVIAATSGATRFKFVATLREEHLRVPIDQLEAEATVFATLDRRLKPGEAWSLIDAMGLRGLPRSDRRELERELKRAKDLPGSVVPAPVALIVPLAIYR